jgi:hypothetical protein
MNLSFKKVDASILCFALVVVAAIPVAALRTKTYALGYELGRLKAEERTLRQKNMELEGQLASVQRSVRESQVRGTSKEPRSQLSLPSQSDVIRPQPQTKK